MPGSPPPLRACFRLEQNGAGSLVVGRAYARNKIFVELSQAWTQHRTLLGRRLR